jgi:hypothetical protein
MVMITIAVALAATATATATVTASHPSTVPHLRRLHRHFLPPHHRVCQLPLPLLHLIEKLRFTDLDSIMSFLLLPAQSRQHVLSHFCIMPRYCVSCALPLPPHRRFGPAQCTVCPVRKLVGAVQLQEVGVELDLGVRDHIGI